MNLTPNEAGKSMGNQFPVVLRKNFGSACWRTQSRGTTYTLILVESFQ